MQPYDDYHKQIRKEARMPTPAKRSKKVKAPEECFVMVDPNGTRLASVQPRRRDFVRNVAPYKIVRYVLPTPSPRDTKLEKSVVKAAMGCYQANRIFPVSLAIACMHLHDHRKLARRHSQLGGKRNGR